MVLPVVLSGLVSCGVSSYDKNTGLYSNPNSSKNQNLDAYLAYIVLCIVAISLKSSSCYLFYNGWVNIMQGNICCCFLVVILVDWFGS